MSAEHAPGRPFDGFASLRFAITELELLAAKLGAWLGADDEATEAATWDLPSWRALHLYERVLADIGTLAGRYVELKIREQHGGFP